MRCVILPVRFAHAPPHDRCAASPFFYFFFFNDTATTEIYTLSLHDALPIPPSPSTASSTTAGSGSRCAPRLGWLRSEEHTSELQSRQYLVCRLLLEKKKKKQDKSTRNLRRTRRTFHTQTCQPPPHSDAAQHH